MIFELSLMTVSALAMIFLLVHKSALNGVKEVTDPLLRDLHQTTGEVLSGFTLKNAVIFANEIFVAIVRLFMNASHAMHKVSSDIVERAASKKEDLSRSGSASFFLKQIKESREAPQNEALQNDVSKTGAPEEKM